MPFAGTYALSGRLAPLTRFRGVPELHEAAAHFRASERIDQTSSRCVLLNSEDYFDLDRERTSAEFVPIDPAAKQAYVENELAPRKLDYESDPRSGRDRAEPILFRFDILNELLYVWRGASAEFFCQTVRILSRID